MQGGDTIDKATGRDGPEFKSRLMQVLFSALQNVQIGFRTHTASY